MATILKLTTVGTSTGTIIPREMLNRLKVEKGDVLFAIETPGGYLISPYDPDVDEQLKVGRQLMKKHRNVLKALAR